ncbi:hypothetical protein SAMN02745945_01149 [Peptoclostridium litorale DSM 5388]|uniref:Uncharacterized protein n=2 Tax=Peptoclostridium litorale TaxID=1557 RepID=A0A069RA71_PEPLI|nr:hypothetical protein [Peptoclostridium litorale]KDR93951.1 hypothetical protein CLIT_23c02230 [Peptoclostridium litorale DSM 5388]KDR95378.1 hypothetical protein CLIT_10c01050 [Peptoclostridium litorale DSM 5388]SIN89207.1 hypothetical protein SAMN02745945_01149 [Peptoclostridium litorale DSM 5388]
MKRILVLCVLLLAMTFSFDISMGQEIYYNGEMIIDEAEYGDIRAVLVERFPTEKIILVGTDFEKNAYISEAKALDFDGEHIAVTGSSGTYLLDIDMNIVLGVNQDGDVVSVGDFICVASKNSIKVFSKEDASIVCQHELERDSRITGMDMSGDVVDIVVEKVSPETGEKTIEHISFLITEEGLFLS